MNQSDALLNLLTLSQPGGIEAQEAAGQAPLVASASMPLEAQSEDDKEALAAAGVVFNDAIDDLFCSVKLPQGWKLKATDHSMWSDLLDDNNCVRASVFYKAAFYDRSAFYRATPRFITNAYHNSGEDGSRNVVVMDGKTKLPAKDFGRYESGYVASKEGESKARIWLTENYPDYRSKSAYWND